MDRYLERDCTEGAGPDSVPGWRCVCFSFPFRPTQGEHLKYTLQVDIIVLYWHFSSQLQLSVYPPLLAAPLFRTCETSNPTSKGGSVKHDGNNKSTYHNANPPPLYSCLGCTVLVFKYRVSPRLVFNSKWKEL